MKKLKVFTITGNLLAQTRLVFDRPKLGETVRAKSSPEFSVGGKGVNCSATCLKWGIRSFAAVFPAGSSGEECETFLRKSGIEIISENIKGQTRRGLVCVDSLCGKETTFLGPDVAVPKMALKRVLKKIGEKSCEGDVLALCGSFPGREKSFASEISELRERKKLKLCLDSYGEPLRDMLEKAKGSIELLKINEREFFESSGLKLSAETLEKFAKKHGIKRIAVSDGPRPLLAFSGGNSFKIKVPKILKEVSATGCGDVMTGVLICEIFARNSEFETALEIAAAAASKSAESPSIPGFSKSEAAKIRKSGMQGKFRQTSALL